MVVNIKVEVFWDVTPCSSVVGYQCLMQDDPPNRRYLITTQKTTGTL
jgi:hypothetical protein